jgi:hypothetical protein
MHRSNSRHLSYVELYTQHMASIDSRKDQAIIVCRQSNYYMDFQTRYLDKITKLLGVVALSLQSRADIAAVSLVASHDTRSSMIPSSAADPSTEYKILKKGRAGGPVTAACLKHRQPVLVQAERATYSMTNQILYAKMSGRRPIPVSMGTSALCVN